MRRRMSGAERAKQFMPFAALTGYELALKERERLYVERPLLAEDAQAELDRRLRALEKGETVRAVFFQKGEIAEITGDFRKTDPVQKYLLVGDTEIPLDELLEIGLA